jgi:DNA-binding CsgD family transcriptional regulator
VSHTSDRRAAGQGWNAEYAELSALDRERELNPVELERLGIAAHLAGERAVSIDALTRAHNSALARGQAHQAARAAYWIAFSLIEAREPARAAGWVARGRRVLDDDGQDCVERGYMLLLQARQQLNVGDLAGAGETLAAAEAVGERFRDRDLTSLARQGRGRVLVATGRAPEGVALFDEVMVGVTAGEVSPLFAGIVYCSVISACFDMLDIRRAQEWTAALNEWCDARPGLVAYRDECRIHRSEIFRLRGQWPEALGEARQACEALTSANSTSAGTAAYGLAELHRLRGEMPEAEKAYARATEQGRTAYPGLALLRLAQGQRDAARAAIERAIAEPSRGRQRANVLAAAVEIFLACGDQPGAMRAADELRALADGREAPWLRAMAAYADGAVCLEKGEPKAALAPLSEAARIWRDLNAPYETARVAVLMGRACRALGDAGGALMEWEAAARVFRQFGALPALAEAEALIHERPAALPAAGGLTARELEVLRLIARGKTNRGIAAELDISEKTVARHVSNIFIKLDLSTRAAAAAYAFTHGLMS